jgi:hypothetical protein
MASASNNNFDIIFNTPEYSDFTRIMISTRDYMNDNQFKTFYIEVFLKNPEKIKNASYKLLTRMKDFLNNKNTYVSTIFGKKIQDDVKQLNSDVNQIFITRINRELDRRNQERNREHPREPSRQGHQGGKRKTKKSKSKKTKKSVRKH